MTPSLHVIARSIAARLQEKEGRMNLRRGAIVFNARAHER